MLQAGQQYDGPNGEVISIESQCNPSLGEIWGATRTGASTDTIDLLVLTEQGLTDAGYTLRP